MNLIRQSRNAAAVRRCWVTIPKSMSFTAVLIPRAVSSAGRHSAAAGMGACSQEDFAFAVAGGYLICREGKGQREFLQAAARIQAQVPHARFLIIGRGSMADVLKADIERLRVVRQGLAWLTPYCHDMPQAMNAIDCLVHSQVGTEAFGLVLLEAFACGKPVIASDLDGIPEAFAVANFGKLVKPESVDELAAAMLEWAKRPRPSPSKITALHARVAEQYSMPAFGRRMIDLYQKIIVT